MATGGFIGPAAQYNLNLAMIAVTDVFGFSCYHVGSSLDRADYRDVDVRCMLADDEFDDLFKSRPGFEKLMAVVVSEWLKQRTGLNIDFQFQRTTEANAEFDSHRNAVGHALFLPGAHQRAVEEQQTKAQLAPPLSEPAPQWEQTP